MQNQRFGRGRWLVVAGAATSFALAGVSAAVLAGQGTAGDTTLTLTQSKPELHATGVSARNPRDGDDLTVFATLSENGKPVGTITGVKVAVRSGSDSAGLGAKNELTRMSLLQFSFSGDDSILVEGLTLDKAGGMVPNDREVRAIAGGTGKYKFARGQVISTRHADGTYTHVIEMRT